jgi:uncharacterized protein (TIGR03435 family)
MVCGRLAAVRTNRAAAGRKRPGTESHPRSRRARRVVHDRARRTTLRSRRLTGTFDFDLRYDGAATSPLPGRGRATAISPDTPSDPARAPSIFTALQEQLGLRLDSQRGVVDVLAVLSAELPTEN